MVMCFVPLCRHYSERKTCRFLKFPRDSVDRQKWIDFISRATKLRIEPTQYSTVCTCHFKNGERKNYPTLFDEIKRKFDTLISDQRRKVVKSSRKHKIKDSAKGPVRQLNAYLKIQALEQPEVTKRTDPLPGPSVQASDSPSQSIASKESKSFSKLKGQFAYEYIYGKDSLTLLYTGISSTALSAIVMEFMDKFVLKYDENCRMEKMNKFDQMLMTLMKLKLNVPNEELGFRFGVNEETVSNVITTWLYALHEALFNQLMKDIPPRQLNSACLPWGFHTCANCRIIIDCVEMQLMEPQRLTNSNYKDLNTWKVLVGVAPSGVITYVSKVYSGSTSDQNIVQHSGILDKMEPGDLIIADRGFRIKDILPSAGVSLSQPSFSTSSQFTEHQARIYVEKAINRLKCYRILDRIPNYFIPHISVLVQTCAALTNFQSINLKRSRIYYSQ